jgi:HTH-type transcriptional regulator/antitoxin HigA
MELSAIKTEEDYEAALREVERLFEVDGNTFDLEQIENFINLIERYEDEHYSIPWPDFANRILYYLESRGFLHR